MQCCECGTFQSQIVKKVPKFSCTLCGTKQSVRQVMAGLRASLLICAPQSSLGGRIFMHIRCM